MINLSNEKHQSDNSIQRFCTCNKFFMSTSWLLHLRTKSTQRRQLDKAASACSRPHYRTLRGIQPPMSKKYLVVGAIGGSRIITSTVQNVHHVLGRGMSIAKALSPNYRAAPAICYHSLSRIWLIFSHSRPARVH